MEFLFYRCDFTGNLKNCLYCTPVTVTDAAGMATLAAFDHVCAEYKNNYRSNDNFIRSNIIIMDCDNDHTDNPKEWITPEMANEEFEEVPHVIVPSRHNMMEKDGKPARPRFHIYFRCPEYTEAAAYAELKVICQRKYPFFDKNALDAARFIYGSPVTEADIIWHDGTKLLDVFLAEQERNVEAYSIPQGERNTTMSRFAGRVVKRYGVSDDAKAIFVDEAQKCDPPLDDAELKRIWDSAEKFGRKVSKSPGYIPPNQYNGGAPNGPAGSLKPADYSDIGQAKVLSAEYGDVLQYNESTDYLHYNEIYWVESISAATGAVEQFLDLQLADAEMIKFRAKQSCLNAGLTAEDLNGKNPPPRANSIQKGLFNDWLDACIYFAFVMKRRDMRFVKSAMEAAKPMVYVDSKELDKDPFLLNTPESTYDLRMGLMGKMEHDAKHMITKVTLAEPGDKGMDLWLEALNKIFCGDAELIGYVQEVIGLAAIGKVFVEALIIAYGNGRNGKSTFFNTILRVMGSYGFSLSADTLIKECKRNTKWEITELKGRRLIIAAELEEGKSLSTSILKQICSTDDIPGEKKFKTPASFKPTHNCVLYTNNLPEVEASDEGTWRRLIVIPFMAKFNGSDDIKNYADYLINEAGPAVVSWIIEGAERVIDKKYNLTRPQCVQDAIDEYRRDSDWLNNYIEERCELDASAKVKALDLYDDYKCFCDRMGVCAHTSKEFGKALIGKGFIRKRQNNGFHYFGLRVHDDLLDDFD